MVLKADQLRVKTLLSETITLLCKNGLHFKTKFSIEGLIGITLDDEDIFLVNINETIKAAEPVQEIHEDTNASEQLPANAKRTLNKAVGVADEVSSRLSERPASPTVVKSLNTSSSIPNIPSSSCARTLRSNSRASPFSDAVKTSRPNRVLRTAEASPILGAFSGSNNSAAELGSDSHLAAGAGLSECESQTFPSVAFKTDETAGDENYDDNKFQQTEVGFQEQPSKRVRLESSDVVTGSSMLAPSSNEINAAFAAPKDSTKSEPPDIIEIKEESLSDNESQQPNYSAYEDYNSAISYGNANAESMQGFVDSSMFQAGSSFFVPQDGEGSHDPDWLRRNARIESIRNGRGRSHSSHDRGSYQCQLCDKRFPWMSGLSYHEDTIHGKRPPPFRCQLCRKGFWTQRDLRGHLASQHDMKKDFHCSICSREYSYKCNLKYHMITVHRDVQH